MYIYLCIYSTAIFPDEREIHLGLVKLRIKLANKELPLITTLYIVHYISILTYYTVKLPVAK